MNTGWMKTVALAGFIFASAAAGQTASAGWQDKLQFHATTAYGPTALAGAAIYSGFLQEIDFPREWGQGAEGYGKRLGSTLAYVGVRSFIGFGLDSALRQDPHYYRSGNSGAWRRVGHAIHGTIFTRTDAGGETFASWRFGSAYAAALISNEWYPDRVNTVALGMEQGTTQMGFDLLANLGFEFWPDVKKKLFHRRP